MNPFLLQALAVFRSRPAASEAEIHAALLAAGIDRTTSEWLLRLLPLAFGRVLLQAWEVRTSDDFILALEGRAPVQGELASLPLWPECVERARKEARAQAHRDAFLAVARYSSEIAAVQRARADGHSGEGRLSPPVFLWPKDVATAWPPSPRPWWRWS